jgi:hypothetical protein
VGGLSLGSLSALQEKVKERAKKATRRMMTMRRERKGRRRRGKRRKARKRRERREKVRENCALTLRLGVLYLLFGLRGNCV